MKREIIKDIFLICSSIVVALVFARSGFFESGLFRSEELDILGSFVAGMFFTSVFTTAPAIVVLGELSLVGHPLLVAGAGAAGALVGDLLIFSFMRERLSTNLVYFAGIERSKRFKKIFRYKFFRWLLSFVGALIIASPLPDELGLALMGFSRMNYKLFVPISLLFNFIGILTISLVARGLF